MQPHWAPRTAGPYCMQHVFNFFLHHRLFLTVARSIDSRMMSAYAWQLSSAHDCSCADACAVVQQYYCEGGGHSPQLHDLPPGADGFLCVAEESDCTSVFSTLQLHDIDQIIVIVANIMEQCSLFLPLQRGAGPMALMLWLDWVT
jgi:hypothetical protein